MVISKLQTGKDLEVEVEVEGTLSRLSPGGTEENRVKLTSG